MKEEPKSWSLAFYKIGSCCESVDNNSTESFNSTITKARAQSMVPMLETIRRQAMHRITKRNRKANKQQGRFTKYVAKILAEEKKDADRCTTIPTTHQMYEVILDGNSYDVNMQKGTCSCCKWKISGIPCEHVYGAMLDGHKDVENYVSGFFCTDMRQDTYELSTIPLRGPRFWMTSTYRLVTAPPPPILPGKKKTTKKQKKYPRIKSKYESPKKKKNETLGRKGRVIHCSSCGDEGHNAAGCKKYPKIKVKKAKVVKAAIVGKVGSSSQGHEKIFITQPTQRSM